MATTYTLIASNTLSSSAASVTFSSIPATYTDLVVKFSVRTTDNDTMLIGLNNVTTSFSSRVLEGNGASAASYSNSSSGRYIGYPIITTTSTFANGEIYIPSYTASQNKPFSAFTAAEANATTAYITAVADLWSNTSAINEVKFTTSTYSFVSGSSFFLYGIKNS